MNIRRSWKNALRKLLKERHSLPGVNIKCTGMMQRTLPASPIRCADSAEKLMLSMNLKTDLVIEEPLSTDFANVCDCVPGLNIYFDVTGGEPLALHSIPFREAAAAESALKNVADAAAVLAKIALNYMTSEDFRNQVNAAE